MRLLLAEDDKELSNVIQKVLKMNKFDVDIAFDGVEALDFINVYVYDVAIIDVMMPKMDGLSLVKLMRSKGVNTPVLILTARAEIDDKVLGLNAGADDYLTKPFSIKELIARIRALSRRSQVFVDSYSIGNLKLDNSTFELCFEDNKIHLTNKEYKIMELLIHNKDSLTSTEKIMEGVWEYDSNADINVVWVYISTLRKKIDDIGANFIIKAVRGLGYKLEEVK